MPEGLHLLGGAGGFTVAALVEVGLVKAGLVLGLAGAGLLALRRSSAGVRHLVPAVALGALLVLPVAALILPDWKIVPTSANARIQASYSVVALPPGRAPSRAARTQAAAKDVPTPPASNAAGTSIPVEGWIVAAWLCGALAVLSRFALGCIRLSRMSRRAGAPAAPLCLRAERLTGELGSPVR